MRENESVGKDCTVITNSLEREKENNANSSRGMDDDDDGKGILHIASSGGEWIAIRQC